MKEVFISYKAEEFEEASWIKQVLENNGISCWMAPGCIPGGSSYAVEIPKAIKEVKVFVLVLSSRAQASQWVSKEVDLAINEGKIILPFMLENCDLKDDFNFYLTNIQRYTAYENKVAAAEKMVTEIRAILGKNDEQKVTQEPQPVYEEPKTAPVYTPVYTPEENKKPERSLDVLSLISMILGAVSVIAGFGMLIVPDIAAIVLSILGVSNVKKQNKKGLPFAIAGQCAGVSTLIIGLCIDIGVAGFFIGLVLGGLSVFFFLNKLKAQNN